MPDTTPTYVLSSVTDLLTDYFDTPNWVHRIDTTHPYFDMGNFQTCVLAQLFGISFLEALYRLNLTPDEATALHFDLPSQPYDSDVEDGDYTHLTQAWQDHITHLQEQTRG